MDQLPNSCKADRWIIWLRWRGTACLSWLQQQRLQLEKFADPRWPFPVLQQQRSMTWIFLRTRRR